MSEWSRKSPRASDPRSAPPRPGRRAARPPGRPGPWRAGALGGPPGRQVREGRGHFSPPPRARAAAAGGRRPPPRGRRRSGGRRAGDGAMRSPSRGRSPARRRAASGGRRGSRRRLGGAARGRTRWSRPGRSRRRPGRRRGPGGGSGGADRVELAALGEERDQEQLRGGVEGDLAQERRAVVARQAADQRLAEAPDGGPGDHEQQRKERRAPARPARDQRHAGERERGAGDRARPDALPLTSQAASAANGT